MPSKLWQKSYSTATKIEEFTVGNDAQLDIELAQYDVQGSLAHIEMLESIGLLTKEELHILQKELKKIHQEIYDGNFSIENGVEDIHSQVELLLTQRLGDVGKKIHSGRSRNDQVLVDLKLYTRAQLRETVEQTNKLFLKLTELSEKFKNVHIPGYTHLQVAMPSSFGLWFGAYAESLVDDMQMLLAAYKITNKNPLGSAAGYGSSFPLDRIMTTNLLGFDSLNFNVVYAQMSRGKTERLVSMALSAVAGTIGRMAMDVTLYMNQNFGFLTFPKELTTGSSIMPHKKNPDVFEIMRGKCNRISALPNEITLLTTNLPSGYHREMQLIKEGFFPAFNTINECLDMAGFMFENIIIKDNILEDEKYKYLFSVENVNELVLQGIPFRDAYKQVGESIENGTFKPHKDFKHTHEGSIGNLSTEKIKAEMKKIVAQFSFKKTDHAMKNLLQS
jgi:argininosuccinate lyase